MTFKRNTSRKYLKLIGWTVYLTALQWIPCDIRVSYIFWWDMIFFIQEDVHVHRTPFKVIQSWRKVITHHKWWGILFITCFHPIFTYKSFLIASEMHNIQTSCQQYCPRFMTSLTSQCNIYIFMISIR